jgi:hypothetical protein
LLYIKEQFDWRVDMEKTHFKYGRMSFNLIEKVDRVSTYDSKIKYIPQLKLETEFNSSFSINGTRFDYGDCKEIRMPKELEEKANNLYRECVAWVESQQIK